MPAGCAYPVEQAIKRSGANLRTARLRRNLTIADVAEKIGTGPRACGLQTAESRLTIIGDRDALLVKRFDRRHADQGYRRAGMLSALTLLRAEDTHQDRSKWSYVLLAEELRRISDQPRIDAPELFRRKSFVRPGDFPTECNTGCIAERGKFPGWTKGWREPVQSVRYWG